MKEIRYPCHSCKSVRVRTIYFRCDDCETKSFVMPDFPRLGATTPPFLWIDAEHAFIDWTNISRG